MHIVNNTNIVNVYKNARIPNAVSGVDASQFGRGRANVIRVPDSQLRGADLVQGRVPLAPNRDSLRVSTRDTHTGQLPRTTANERFFSRRQPDRVDRVPFDQQQRAMEQVARRTFNQPATVRTTEAATAPAIVNTPRSGQGTGSDNWRRIGGAGSSPTAPEQTAAPGNQGNGWRRFERPSGPPPSQPDRTPPVDRNSGGGQIRVSPPIVRQREAAPAPPPPSPHGKHHRRARAALPGPAKRRPGVGIGRQFWFPWSSTSSLRARSPVLWSGPPF